MVSSSKSQKKTTDQQLKKLCFSYHNNTENVTKKKQNDLLCVIRIRIKSKQNKMKTSRKKIKFYARMSVKHIISW